MRHTQAILAVAMAISLAGCVLKGKAPVAVATPAVPKPAAPAPPPAPPASLSIPQTHAELPAPQPVSAEALATTDAPGEPPAPVPVTPRPPRKNQPARPRPEAATPPPPTATPPAEPEPRPQIQEIVPPEDLKNLQAAADQRKQQIRQRLSRLPHRGLTKEQRDAVDTIQSFLRLSDDAERSGDMRKAFELADRGLVLAQGLTNGR